MSATAAATLPTNAGSDGSHKKSKARCSGLSPRSVNCGGSGGSVGVAGFAGAQSVRGPTQLKRLPAMRGRQAAGDAGRRQRRLDAVFSIWLAACRSHRAEVTPLSKHGWEGERLRAALEIAGCRQACSASRDERIHSRRHGGSRSSRAFAAVAVRFAPQGLPLARGYPTATAWYESHGGGAGAARGSGR